MIEDYAEKLMAGTRELILRGDRKDYVDEVPFMASLVPWMGQRGWPSSTDQRYPGLTSIPDLVSTGADGTCTVTCEEKHYRRSFPTHRPKYETWSQSILSQYLGIVPGKSNNAVEDVTVKLDRAGTTHVAFLLVRVEAYCNPGDDDIRAFIGMASLDGERWRSRYDEWPHPRDPAYQFRVHLWYRRREE